MGVQTGADIEPLALGFQALWAGPTRILTPVVAEKQSEVSCWEALQAMELS